MYRGTTPTITCKFNNEINLNAFDEIWVTFKGTKGIMTFEITLNKEDLTIDAEKQTISFMLSQQQTLKFASYSKLQCQIRFFIDGDPPEAYATNIVDLVVKDILKDGVIS